MTVTNKNGTKIHVTSATNKNEQLVAELLVEEKGNEDGNNDETQALEVTLKVPTASGFMQSAGKALSPHLQHSFSPREFQSFAGGYDTVKRSFGRLFDEDGDGIVTRAEFMSAIATVRAESQASWTDDDINLLFDELDTDFEDTLKKSELVRGFRPYFDQVNSIADIGGVLGTVMKCIQKNRARKDNLTRLLKTSNYYWECFVAALPLAEMSLDIAVCYALFLHGEYTLGTMSLVFQALAGRLGFFVDFGQKRDPMIRLNTAADLVVIYIPFATFLAHKLAKIPIHFADLVIGELVVLLIFYVFYFQSIVTKWHAATLILNCVDPVKGECRLLVPEDYAPSKFKQSARRQHRKAAGSSGRCDTTIIGDDPVARYMTDFDDAADICRAGFVIEVVQGFAHPIPQILIQLIAGLKTGLLSDPDWQPVFVSSLVVSAINLSKAFYTLCTSYNVVVGALQNLIEETAQETQRRNSADDGLVEG